MPVILNVVINAGIDQMLLFAKSFAHDHDGYFAWMGHSRVGGGFDALQFRAMLRASPQYYTVTEFGTKNLDIIAHGLHARAIRA